MRNSTLDYVEIAR